MVTICNQLKLPSHKDGKLYKTDVATVKQLFRIIQTIPSPNAEPFKQWLAQVGSERLDEIADPEIVIERSVATYREKRNCCKRWWKYCRQCIKGIGKSNRTKSSK